MLFSLTLSLASSRCRDFTLVMTCLAVFCGPPSGEWLLMNEAITSHLVGERVREGGREGERWRGGEEREREAWCGGCGCQSPPPAGPCWVEGDGFHQQLHLLLVPVPAGAVSPPARHLSPSLCHWRGEREMMVVEDGAVDQRERLTSSLGGKHFLLPPPLGYELGGEREGGRGREKGREKDEKDRGGKR